MLQFIPVQCARNANASSASGAAYLVQLQYQRLSMVALEFSDNYCRDANATLALTKSGQFDDAVEGASGDGCLMMTDCAVSVAHASFARNNGTFIWQLRRDRLGGMAQVAAVPACMSALHVDADFAHAFLYVVNYTASDALSFAQSNMSSAWLNYMFLVDGQNTADANRSEGARLTMDAMRFERIGSAVLKWDTSATADGNYYLALNVTRSQFATTALIVALNELTSNEETLVKFSRNVFRNYTDNSSQPFMFSLATAGAPLLFVLEDNELRDLAPDDFYVTSGPVSVRTVNHTSNQDDYADLVDPLRIVIQAHRFGPNFDNLAIQVRRRDTLAVPVSTIEIIDSVFEHATSDQEMCRFYNIQPADSIIIRGSSFVHAFCTFHFGATLDAQPLTLGGVEIWNSSFADYSSSHALAVYDLAADAELDGDHELLLRNTIRINDSSFWGARGPATALIAKLNDVLPTMRPGE